MYKCRIPGCPWALKGFKSGRNWSRHEATHDPDRPRVICMICKKSYSRHDALLRHQRHPKGNCGPNTVATDHSPQSSPRRDTANGSLHFPTSLPTTLQPLANLELFEPHHSSSNTSQRIPESTLSSSVEERSGGLSFEDEAFIPALALEYPQDAETADFFATHISQLGGFNDFTTPAFHCSPCASSEQGDAFPRLLEPAVTSLSDMSCVDRQLAGRGYVKVEALEPGGGDLQWNTSIQTVISEMRDFLEQEESTDPADVSFTLGHSPYEQRPRSTGHLFSNNWPTPAEISLAQNIALSSRSGEVRQTQPKSRRSSKEVHKLPLLAETEVNLL